MVAVGGVTAFIGFFDTVNGLSGEFELPMIFYTPYAIFSNSVPVFDINFFSPNTKIENDFVIFSSGEVEKGFELKSESSGKVLQPIVSGWYYAIRNIAIVAMLTILVYIGIRMLIATVSKDKAKYKQMLMDWLVAMCLIIVMHYVMIFIVQFTEKIGDMFQGMSVENIVIPLPEGTEYELDGVWHDAEVDPNTKLPFWGSNSVGYARLLAGGLKTTDSMQSVTNTIIYVVFVIYTVIFTIIYLKRVVYMAFLTVIAPLVAMTYPLDKIHDGKAQGFSKWLEEYIFNALLAPIHMLLYGILIGSAGQLAINYPIYALVAIGFIIPAEKILRNFFGFSKAETPGNMGAIGIAGTGMLMSGLHRLMRGNKHKEKEKEKEDTEDYRFERYNSNYNRVFENYENYRPEDKPQISTTQQNEPPQIEQSNNQPTPDNNGYKTQWTDYGANPSNLGPNGEMIIQGTHGFESNRNTNSEIRPKRSIKNGIKNVASMGWHRFKGSRPVEKLLKGLAYGAGAVALAPIGLAAGIASGDLGKTVTYTGSAAHIGGSVNSKISGAVFRDSRKGNIINDFERGYYGTQYDQKVLEEAIKEWQSDPRNIQYLRAREQNYKEIMENIYPEYAKYGCYEMPDFYAAYQLEKAGKSRGQAISTYELAKRIGNITTSPDSSDKWKKRLQAEFGSVQDIRNIMNQQYRQVEKELEDAEKEINSFYDAQIREVQSTGGMHESALKEKKRRLEEKRNEALKGVSDSIEAKRIRIKEIPEQFAERALDDVKEFYNNKK